MSKYDALGQYLREQTTLEVHMSFADIERLVGRKLPPSAHRHRPWWSNNPRNSVMTKVWLEAGYRTEQVDMKARTVVFRRSTTTPGLSGETHSYKDDEPKKGRHPMIGALKGTFSIAPGTDLTQPAMPEWADFLDEKYGKEHKR